MTHPRPNILFINIDQLRPDFMGCYGFPHDTTPALDRLAAGGVLVTGMYCASPMCTPSRYSLLSGLFPSSHGALTNGMAPRPGVRSLVGEMSAQGYHTVCFGKLHHDPPDSSFGFDEVFLHDGTFRDRRPYSVYSRWLLEHGVDEDDLAYPADIDENPEKKRLRDRIHWGRCRLGDEWTESTFLSRFAISHLERLSGKQPVFCYASFVAPHSPYCPPAPYDEAFDSTQMPVPQRETEEQLDAKHSWLRRHREERYLGAIPEPTVRAIRAQYAGLLKHADLRIGELIDAFRERFGRDSLVVVTSDHGDLLGEHHQVEKALMYEASVRVPCILSWPGQLAAGSQLEGLLHQTDLIPTVMGLVGLRVPEGLEGEDRSQEIQSGQTGSPIVFAENYQTPYGDHLIMARSATHKLISYQPKSGGPAFEEFYDLIADPNELNNLAPSSQNHSEFVRLSRALEDWLAGLQTFQTSRSASIP